MNAARELYVEIGDARGEARTEWSRATAVMSAGRAEDALPIFESARVRFAELGDAWYHAMATGSIAWARFAMGDMVGASHRFVQSLVEYHALGDVATTAISLQIGAIVALEAGRSEDGAVLVGAVGSLSERYGVKPPAGLAWLIKSHSRRSDWRRRWHPTCSRPRSNAVAGSASTRPSSSSTTSGPACLRKGPPDPPRRATPTQ